MKNETITTTLEKKESFKTIKQILKYKAMKYHVQRN